MSRSSGLPDWESGWRGPILKHFTPEIATVTRLTIVSDPDDLLAEEVLVGELRARGFHLLPFDDHVAFRFAYESCYRKIWDRGDQTNLVVVLRCASGDLDTLPYDLLESARRQDRCLRFSVGKLFPKLAPSVVTTLDRSCFDKVFTAQAEGVPTRLGSNATKDFALRHVFKIAPELITNPARLLSVLLQKHYRGLSFPAELDERLVFLLREFGCWNAWPLEQIVPSRTAFLAFLDERWPHFVRQSIKADQDAVFQSLPVEGLRFSGPVGLPFGHHDVRVYIDNLFQEGRLTPADGYSADQVPEPWMRVGVAGPGSDDRVVRFNRLQERLAVELPAENDDRQVWIEYARTWAEWAALRWELVDSKVSTSHEACEGLHDQIEARFVGWMRKNYTSLHSLSPFGHPAMVHHIPSYMAHSFVPTVSAAIDGSEHGRCALVVVDGLALDQWAALRDDVLGSLGEDVEVNEGGTFAWVPTLTAISRQAIFAGAIPLFFADSLRHTSQEKRRWKRFWQEKGASTDEIGYVRESKNRADDDLLENVLEMVDRPKIRILAIVVGKVDQSLHGVTTGSGGLHALVRQWARSGALSRLLDLLIEREFKVFLTADHGNIHGRGIGRPNVGVIADERGIRAHVFNDESTRANVACDYPEAIEWPQIGLPEHYRALLAPSRGAFVPVGTESIGHGGIAMEEVIVPFVQIARRER